MKKLLFVYSNRLKVKLQNACAKNKVDFVKSTNFIDRSLKSQIYSVLKSENWALLQITIVETFKKFFRY